MLNTVTHIWCKNPKKAKLLRHFHCSHLSPEIFHPRKVETNFFLRRIKDGLFHKFCAHFFSIDSFVRQKKLQWQLKNALFALVLCSLQKKNNAVLAISFNKVEEAKADSLRSATNGKLQNNLSWVTEFLSQKCNFFIH